MDDNNSSPLPVLYLLITFKLIYMLTASKTVYHAPTKKTYLVTNQAPYQGCLMMTENYELHTIMYIGFGETLLDMGAKVVKDISSRVMSPYVYPGLPVNINS
jgi:hypothetical protein